MGTFRVSGRQLPQRHSLSRYQLSNALFVLPKYLYSLLTTSCQLLGASQTDHVSCSELAPCRVTESQNNVILFKKYIFLKRFCFGNKKKFDQNDVVLSKKCILSKGRRFGKKISIKTMSFWLPATLQGADSP